VTFQYRGLPGPLGCLMGLFGGLVFLVLAVVLLAVGSLFFLLGGRRIAAALFRRAMKRHGNTAQPFHWTQNQDPDVIDVQAEEIMDVDDGNAK